MTTAAMLREAAKRLDTFSDPFSDGFLNDHEVTFDQCMVLAQQLALGARMVANGIDSPTSDCGIAMLMTMADSE